jgi:hypothetical protein
LRPDGWEEVFDPDQGGWVTGDEGIDPDAPPAPDDSFAEGQPCKPGERSDLTGCVPSTGEARREARKKGREQALKEQLSKPPVLLGQGEHESRARAVRRLFPESNLSTEELPKLVGAPNGGRVTAYANQAGDQIHFGMDHPHVKEFSRTLHRTPDGKLVMSNNLFFLKKAHRGSGMGLDVFSSEVRQLAALGVDRIDTCAGKGGIMNGYYTWARLGYDAPLDAGFQKRLPPALAGAKTVQDLMTTPEGRDHWKANGYMTPMSFDLTPGSGSLKVLDAYMAAKGKPPVSPDAAKVSALKEARAKAAAELPEREKHEAAVKDSADAKRHWSDTCRAVGLPAADLDTRAAAWEKDYAARYEARPAGQAWGMGPNRPGYPPRYEAYREAVQDMVRERHERRMTSTEPAYATTRAKMEAEAKQRGLDPPEVRRLAAQTPNPQEDGVLALASSYRQATDTLAKYDWLPDGSFAPKGSKPGQEQLQRFADSGGPCKPGERSDLTGCVPSEGSKGTGSKPNKVVEGESGEKADQGVGTKATAQEHAAVVAKAKAKFAGVKQPTPEAVAAAKAGMAELGANKYRKKLVGNVYDRARRRAKLYAEFGDPAKKVCPCVYCGVRVGEGTLEQDKILTTAQGGRYTPDNTLPSCSDCNKRRGDMPFEEALAKVVKHAGTTP